MEWNRNNEEKPNHLTFRLCECTQKNIYLDKPVGNNDQFQRLVSIKDTIRCLYELPTYAVIRYLLEFVKTEKSYNKVENKMNCNIHGWNAMLLLRLFLDRTMMIFRVVKLYFQHLSVVLYLAYLVHSSLINKQLLETLRSCSHSYLSICYRMIIFRTFICIALGALYEIDQMNSFEIT